MADKACNRMTIPFSVFRYGPITAVTNGITTRESGSMQGFFVKKHLFFASLFLLAVVCAVSRVGGAIQQTMAGPGAALAAEADAGVQAKELETEKWNSYVIMERLMNEYFFEALDNYTAVFGNEAEPSKNAGQVAVIDFSNSGTNIARLDQLIDKAVEQAAKTPQSDLDKQVAGVAPVLKSLVREITALGPYMRDKEYMDDGWAKAAEAHPRVLAAMAEFWEKYPAYDGAMAKKAQDQREVEIAEMQAEGLVILPAMLAVLYAVEDTQAFFDATEETNPKGLAGLTAEAVRPYYDEFVKRLKAFEAVKDNPDQVVAEDILPNGINTFTGRAKEYKTNLATMLEGLQTNKGVGSGFEEGAPDALDRAYQRVVDEYNYAIKQ